MFPLVCGVSLNLATLPLFPGATIASRIAYHSRAPYSAFFLTWTAGTIFMFVVAQWITLCRATLRPGALFFIRDPKDPEASPIKEMMEGKIHVQIIKLSKSVLLYTALMLAFGCATYATAWMSPDLLPLRWDLQ